MNLEEWKLSPGRSSNIPLSLERKHKGCFCLKEDFWAGGEDGGFGSSAVTFSMLNVKFGESEEGVGEFNCGCLQECASDHRRLERRESPKWRRDVRLAVGWHMLVDALYWTKALMFVFCQSLSLPPLLWPPPPHTAEMQPPKVSDESCDDDSSCSLSPGPSGNAESPLGLLPLLSLPQVLAGSSGTTPAMVGHRMSGRGGVMISEHWFYDGPAPF